VGTKSIPDIEVERESERDGWRGNVQRGRVAKENFGGEDEGTDWRTSSLPAT
jgi:hypothetical protein